MQLYNVTFIIAELIEAAVFLGLGIKLLNHKPLVLPSRLMKSFIALFFIPIFIVGPLSILVKDFSVGTVFFVIIGLATAAVLLILYNRSMGGLIVFNVEEEVLYRALMKALDKNGIQYEEKRSTVQLTGRDTKLKVNVQDTMESGNISIKGAFPELKQVAVDLRTQLEGVKLDSLPYSGITYTLLGLLLFALGIGFVLPWILP